MQRAVTLITILFSLTLQAQASQDGQKKHTLQKGSSNHFEIGRDASFSPAERNLIRSQLLEQRHTSPSNEDQKGPYREEKGSRLTADLPPDWQEGITIGRSLDYHIYKRGMKLPENLLQKLPQQPRGSETLLVKDKIIRIEAKTRTILDTFDLIPTR